MNRRRFESVLEEIEVAMEKGEVSRDLFEKIKKSISEIQEYSECMSVMDFVNIINKAHKKDKFVSIYMMGIQGDGKTTLAFHISAYVYAYRYRNVIKPSYRKAFRHLFFDPLEALDWLFDIHEKNVERGRYDHKVKNVINDDAGAWLFKLSNDFRTQTYLRFSNLIRTLASSVIYTDVMSISKYIRDTAGYRLLVQTIPRYCVNDDVIDPLFASYLDSDVEWSIAIVYRNKLSVKFQTYTPRYGFIIYPQHIPNKVYRQYKKARAFYLQRLRREFKKRMEEYRNRIKIDVQLPPGMSKIEFLRKVFGEGNGSEEKGDEFQVEGGIS